MYQWNCHFCLCGLLRLLESPCTLTEGNAKFRPQRLFYFDLESTAATIPALKTKFEGKEKNGGISWKCNNANLKQSEALL